MTISPKLVNAVSQIADLPCLAWPDLTNASQPGKAGNQLPVLALLEASMLGQVRPGKAGIDWQGLARHLMLRSENIYPTFPIALVTSVPQVWYLELVFKLSFIYAYTCM
jgi:hypothetical protein